MIRKAHILDVLSLTTLLPKYQPETGNHELFPVDIDHAVQQVMQAIADPCSCVLVAVKGTEVVGFMYAVCTSFFWSKTLVAVDQLLYVTPEHRGGTQGIALIRAYEKWAVSKGVQEIRISIASGITEERTRKLYLALGYEPLGYTYRKELNSGKLTVTASTANTSQAT